MKITNICDSEHLTDCGLPDKIIPVNGGTAINLSSITTIKNYNNLMGILKTTEDDNLNWSNTFAAAFETVNGESVLVYYNPNCENDLKEPGTTWYFSQPKMCANFIYDLNGKKGPNTVGKDIGIITALYATDPVVVAPHFYPYSTDKYNYGDAIEICKSDNDKKMPNISEAMSIFYNKKLFGVTNAGAFWSSSIKASNAIWSVSFDNGKMGTAGKSDKRKAICVKR